MEESAKLDKNLVWLVCARGDGPAHSPQGTPALFSLILFTLGPAWVYRGETEKNDNYFRSFFPLIWKFGPRKEPLWIWNVIYGAIERVVTLYCPLLCGVIENEFDSAWKFFNRIRLSVVWGLHDPMTGDGLVSRLNYFRYCCVCTRVHIWLGWSVVRVPREPCQWESWSCIAGINPFFLRK